MNWKAQRAALLAAIEATVKAAKDDDDRDLNADEVTLVETKSTEIEDGDAREAKRVEQKARIDALRGTPTVSHTDDGSGDTPKPTEKAAEPATGPVGLGTAFVKSAAFADFRKAHPSGVGSGTPIRIEARGITGAKATLTTEVLRSEIPRYAPIYEDLAPLSILDLVTLGTMDTAAFEYLQVGALNSNAAIVPEGDLKPLSDFATTLADAKAYTYADGVDVTNQMLADAGALASYLDPQLRFAVRNEVERVLFEGTGTNGEPAGILNTTGVQAQAFDTDVIDTIAAALEKLETAYALPSAIVMSIADAWKLQKLKDTQGRYFSGGPFGVGGANTVWGIPVVKSRRIAAGTFVAGDFRTVALFEREAMSVLAFNQHKDYAQRNMTYIRAEWRGAQAIFKPAHLVVGETISGV